jgi:general stress protein 26
MADLTLHDLSEKMRDIDFTMLFTKSEDGALAGRPMSNNREVEYTGDSFFFTDGDTRTVRDIERDPTVSMSVVGSKSLLGKPPIFIAVEGKAELIRDKAEFEKRWHKELDYWFDDGIDTPGLTLIKVHATRIHYWDGRDEGEIRV